MLPADHEVFVVRPGAQYKLYKYVADDSTILLDLPGLDLDRQKALVEHEDLESRILRSVALRNWYRGGRARGEARPIRSLSSYPSTALSKHRRRSVQQFVRISRGYLELAKRGDLVLVPPKAFVAGTLLGELTGSPAQYVSRHIDEYERDALIGRRVRWLASFPKGELSGEIIDIIQKPNAFVTLRKSLRQKIYERAYGNYVVSDEYTTRITTSSEEFTSTDDLKINAFLNFVAFNLMQLDRDGSPSRLDDVVFADLGDYSLDLTASINSPGTISVLSKRVTPLVVSALLALALNVGASAVDAAEQDRLKIGNATSADNDPCVAEVRASTIKFLKLIGVDNWVRACEIAKQVEANTGLKPRAVINSDSN